MRLKIRNKATCILVGVFSLLLISTAGFAQIPQTVSYQGFLTDSGGPVDTGEGTIDVQFAIFNVLSGGSALWTDMQSVIVNQGVYSVTFTGLGGLTFNAPYYLEVAIDEDTSGTIELAEILTPRQSFTAMPYALNADRVDGQDASSFITSETDPTVAASVKDGVSWAEVTGKPAGFADNLDDEGVTVEADPVFGASASSGITGGNISNWNTAFSWGDHTGSGYDTTNDSWTGTGNITMTTGNVGIGTTSPGAYLHVAENSAGEDVIFGADISSYNSGVDISIGDTNFDTYVYFGQSNSNKGFLSWRYNSTAANAYAQLGTYAGSNPLSLQPAGGNVGIGTTSPSAKLEVVGNIDATTSGSAFTVQGTNSTSGSWGYLGGPSYGVFGRATGSNSAVYGNNSTSGNFGTLGGNTEGVQGYSANNGQYGVYGRHLLATNDTPAVYGEHTVTDYYGVGVKGRGGYMGVVGESLGTGTGTYTGVYGSANTNAAGGTTRGVRGFASGGSTNYGGYFIGSGGGSAGVGVYASGGTYAGIFAGNYIRVNGAGNEQAYIGGDGWGSDVQIGSSNAAVTSVGLWNTASASRMDLYVRALHISGGADLAEPFDTMDSTKIEPGMLVVIDSENPGQLKISERAYDRTVAGVVSGANGIKPGVTMRQEDTDADGTVPVALTGRVYAWADSSHGAIEAGDLLTTSDTPGHAMKVTDHAKASGTIIGKAMSSLKEGRGLVLILVSLQ